MQLPVYNFNEKIDEEVIEAAPHLKVIANMAVVFDI